MVGPRRLKYPTTSPGDKRLWVSGEALKTRGDAAEGSLVLLAGDRTAFTV